MLFFNRRVDPRLLWGSLLIIGGVLFLLQNLKLLPGGAIFWGGVLGVAGLMFLWGFIADRSQWWPLIPGLTLVGIGITVLLTAFAETAAAHWSGTIILGSIGLSFWLIYLFHRENWWAVIPGGVLFTLAAVAWVELNLPAVRGLETGGIFFLGLGFTFLLLGVLPTPSGKMWWPFIPGGILTVMGVLITLAFGSLLNVIGPALLIVGGVLLLWRAFRKG
jgi:hypothetical protein